jgi:catechol 2,3-dioxygenase-like lactoylglutathione lyase family enzyme
VTVSDVDRALGFYREGLGFEIDADETVEGKFVDQIMGMPSGKVRLVWLRMPDTDMVFELRKFLEVDGTSIDTRSCDLGVGHICLFVDDAEALVARVRKLGYSAGEIATVPDGPASGAKVTFLHDPDGFGVEVVQLAD